MLTGPIGIAGTWNDSYLDGEDGSGDWKAAIIHHDVTNHPAGIALVDYRHQDAPPSFVQPVTLLPPVTKWVSLGGQRTEKRHQRERLNARRPEGTRQPVPTPMDR